MKKPTKGGKVVQKFAYGGMSRNDDKSGVAGPGGNRSGNTSKSSTKSGGSVGGGGKSGGLGITTGKTIHGNTAFGPAGGMAKGYATSKGGSGMGPSNKSFSNFKTLDGNAMYGNMGNKSVTARNAGQANSMMSALSRAKGTPKRSVTPTASTAAPKPRPKAPVKQVGLKVKAAIDQTLEKFKPWWNEKVTVGPVPVRPRQRPANRWDGKKNGPLGKGWEERVGRGSANPWGTKGKGPLGSGAYDRISGDDES
jgi:hypothetical protein